MPPPLRGTRIVRNPAGDHVRSTLEDRGWEHLVSSDADRVEQLIDGVKRQVLAASTLEEALDAVTLSLRDPYRLWRSSVWSFEPPDVVRLVAVWAIGDTGFERGMVVKVTLTSDTEYVANRALAGSPMVVRTSERDLGLLTDMMRREGIASSVVVPVGPIPGEPTGLVVLSSSDPDAFGPRDLRLVTALIRSIDERISALLEQETERMS